MIRLDCPEDEHGPAQRLYVKPNGISTETAGEAEEFPSAAAANATIDSWRWSHDDTPREFGWKVYRRGRREVG